MELGIGMFGDIGRDANGQLLSAPQRLRELVEEIRLMDEAGLDFFGIGEHHRPEYAVSTPEIVLAAAAGQTKNIRLGSAVSVLSSSDPVRLYQSFATLDGISNGRAELVVGRGSFIESFPVYGYDLQHYDALFEEKLELLLELNKNERVTWKGQFRPALNDQPIFPRAVRPEGLDIWVAVGGTPESVLRAAKHDLPIIFAIIGGNPAQFAPLFDYYRRARAHFGHTTPERIGVHMHAFFGDDNKATADAYYPVYAGQMDRIGRDRGWPPFQRSQFEAGRGPKGHLLIGEAKEAVDKILALKETLGFTRFSAHMDVGGPDHRSLMRSIEIFGAQIAPEVQQAVGG